MKLLLDTHTLIWAVDEPRKLSSIVVQALEDRSNELLVSVGTVWEVSIKVGLGKLQLSLPYREWVTRAIAELGASVLALSIDHADRYATLPFYHRDPFDRLLIAQSLCEDIALVSRDTAFDQFSLTRLW